MSNYDAAPVLDHNDLFAGWTDEEIDAYAREVDERDAFLDEDFLPGGPDFDSKPPF